MACLNHVSNWVKGLASSWEGSREPLVYCWAWGEAFVPPGAKMRLLVGGCCCCCCCSAGVDDDGDDDDDMVRYGFCL